MQLLIEIDSSGPRELLQQMVGRLENPRPMMNMLGRYLEDYEKDVFATSGYGTWAPDDPDTLEQKTGGRTLVDDGLLFRNMTSSRVIGDTVQVDEGPAFYARFLRDGDRGMPRRNPAPKPERRHVDKWADSLVHYIRTGRA